MSSSTVVHTGPISDPRNRTARARKAARSRTSLDHHIAKLVDAAPELTSAQRDKLATLLRPSQSGGRAA